MAAQPDRAGPRRRRQPRARRPGVDRMSAPASRPLALITGGAGFVATNVADRLLRNGWRVRLFDNFSRAGGAKNIEWLCREHAGADSSLIEVVRGDVRDAAALMRAVEGTSRV